MTDNHPITPPPEMLHQWATEYWGNPGESIGEGEKYIATQAARWGADQELEACIKTSEDTWDNEDVVTLSDFLLKLRATRRPKPPSPKEEALQVLENLIETRRIVDPEYQALRHALEALPE